MASPKRTEKQKEILKEYRKEMRKANDRLRRLEELSKNPDYENVLNYAYKIAARDVKELGVGDIEKVRYRIPTNTNKMEAALKRVKRFNNELKTTTKRDIDKVYVQDAINFNRKFGTNFTWQEVKTFADQVDWNTLKKNYGSDVIARVIKSIKKNNVTPEMIKEATSKHKNVVKDEVESDWIKRLYKEGLKPDMLTGTSDFVPDLDNESPFIN